MKPRLTDTLCTQCGLCCDGTLFADVELANSAEAAGLEAMGLDIEEDDNGDGLLVQPCVALQGRRCGIYAQRPECCRTFECRLLRNVRRGAVSLPRAREIVAETQTKIGRLRQLAAELGQADGRLTFRESCVEAMELGDETRSSPDVERKRAELESGMSAVEDLIQKQFLGGSTSRS